MQRRSLLAGLAGCLAAGFAPAAVGSGILMPVRKIVMPTLDQYIMRIHDKQGNLVLGFLENGNAVITGKFELTDAGQDFINRFARHYAGEIIKV